VFSKHSTQKPVALMEYLIRTYTNEEELILDNTMGSGTTLLAAQNTKRRAIGIETDKHFCDVAIERLQSANLPLGI
jgi:site-specific DNA-methyltransferase (adenine-specific)